MPIYSAIVLKTNFTIQDACHHSNIKQSLHSYFNSVQPELETSDNLISEHRKLQLSILWLTGESWKSIVDDISQIFLVSTE